MKKLTYILLLLCLACSSSDDTIMSTFEVSVTQNTTTLEVDQILTLTATANETINQISFSKDGGETFGASILLITDGNGNAKEKRHFDACGKTVKVTDGNNSPWIN